MRSTEWIPLNSPGRREAEPGGKGHVNHDLTLAGSSNTGAVKATPRGVGEKWGACSPGFALLNPALFTVVPSGNFK